MTELLTAVQADFEKAQAQAEDWSAETVIEWSANTFGNQIALSTSFQTDGMVILDMANRLGIELRVATIDTGRMPPETYHLMDEIRDRYQYFTQAEMGRLRAAGYDALFLGVEEGVQDYVIRYLATEDPYR